MTVEIRFVHCALNPNGTRGAWYVFRRVGRWSGYKRVAQDGPGTRMEADRMAQQIREAGRP